MMIARGLLQAGARVYISSRKESAVDAAVGELSSYGKVTGIAADLAQTAECQRLVSEVGASEDALHVLVNNAGATWGEPFDQFPESGWDKVVDLNLKTP